MSVTGVILAAGASTRMGSPKALLLYRGRTFLATLTALLHARCDDVIVVAGAHVALISTHVEAPTRLLINTEWQHGQTSSLQCALRAVAPATAGIVLTLVDHPAWNAQTLDALLVEPRPLIRVPRYKQRRGHPVWLSSALFDELLALNTTQGARDVVHAHDEETELVDVDDEGVVLDIDDAEAYAQLRAR